MVHSFSLYDNKSSKSLSKPHSRILMAMSPAVSQSLPRACLRSPTALTSHLRRRSSKTHHAEIIEVDLDTSSSPQSDSDAAAEVITIGIKKLEDAIQRIVVRRAAPAWLPFLPGYSYWVPPRSSSLRRPSAGSMMEAIGKLSSLGLSRNSRLSTYDLLSEDEQMSYTSAKGWPSSAFFIDGTSQLHPITVAELEVKIEKNEDDSNDTSDSEGEEV